MSYDQTNNEQAFEPEHEAQFQQEFGPEPEPSFWSHVYESQQNPKHAFEDKIDAEPANPVQTTPLRHLVYSNGRGRWDRLVGRRRSDLSQLCFANSG